MFIDFVFVILIVFALIKGLRKGLIMAAFSIIGFVAGLAAALKLSSLVAERISDHMSSSYRWMPLLSFIIVFIIVALIINLSGKALQKVFETVLLGWVNRIGGVILYICLYSFIFSIFLFYAVQLMIIKPATAESSIFYPYLQPLGPLVINGLGEIIPVFKNMFEELQHFFGRISNKV